MSGLWALMEAPAVDPRSLRRRTDWLVAIHLVLAVAAITVIGLVVWRVRFLITLAQRSNVETLVIGVVVILLGYLLITTGPAAIGSARLLGYRLLGTERAQRALQRTALADTKQTMRSYLNLVVRGPDGADIEVPIEDRFGRLCSVRIHLAEVAFVDAPRELTHSVVQLIVRTLARVGTLDGTDHELKVLYWDSLEEAESEAYASQVGAFDRLERALGTAPLWPALQVDSAGVSALKDMLREAAPVIRENLLLPDIEYSAEFSIPIVPEPFAFMQLTRRQEHADPVAAMGCAAIVALGILAVIAWILVNPPWVPGK